uniref:DUF2655 domain-containing protein n=1 Tax=Macrostomum lignano TaxID=282301 RepID=A0A1I8F5L7_9PLAT
SGANCRGVSIPPASKVRRLDNGEQLRRRLHLASCWCRDGDKVHVAANQCSPCATKTNRCRAVVTHELPRDAYVVRFLGAPTLARQPAANAASAAASSAAPFNQSRWPSATPV